MQPTPLHNARAQQGFGLIEILVALVIGLFVLLGLASVFLSVKQTFNTQEQLSQLQDQERLALTILTTTLQSAGYFPDPVTQTSVTALQAKGNFVDGQSTYGESGDKDKGTSDSISVRYLRRANDGIMDCLGATLTSGADTVVTNSFSISANHELVCSLDDGTTNTVLVNGVQSMSILYGTDSSNGGMVDRYLTATELTTGTLWPNVQTARITLTLINPFAADAGQPATVQWVHTINLMNRKSA